MSLHALELKPFLVCFVDKVSCSTIGPLDGLVNPFNQGRSQEFVHGGANSKVEIDDDEYHYCMGSLYF